MDTSILHLKILTSHGQELKELAQRLEVLGGSRAHRIYLRPSWFSRDEDVRRWCQETFRFLRPKLNRGNKIVLNGMESK